MTEFSRSIILEKIDQLMQRTQAPQDIYQWGLGFIVTKGFDQFAADDPAAAKAVKALLDINEDHKVTINELKILEYYRQCLSGQRELIEIGPEFEYPHLPQGLLDKWNATPEEPEETGLKQKILHWLRIYVYIFAVYVLISNFWMLLKLGGPWSPKRIQAMITFPFFVYGGLLVLPMQVLTKGKIFTAILTLSILAIAYFWFGVFQTIFAGRFYFLNFLVELFLGAVPASATVWLLVYEKYMKSKTVENSES